MRLRRFSRERRAFARAGKIADALGERGWSEDEVLDFAAGNWMRMFEGIPA